jgi:uncharacterized OB-fold protein
MNPVAPLLPDVSNPLLAPHWEAAARQRLAIPFCAGCEAPRWPPRTNCPRCHGFDVEWREIPARGELFTYFVARKALHPSLAGEVPYATGVVAVPAGVRLLGRLTGLKLEDIEIGMPVQARFVARVPGVTLVYWEPDSRRAGDSSAR